jgi:hypothetical protein
LVSAATAPTTGQVLTATDSTHATWQAPSSGGGGNNLISLVTGAYQVLGTEGTRAIGQFQFNPSWIPSGKSVKFCCVGSVSDVLNTGTARLYNVTDGEFVTDATLNFTSTSSAYLESAALTVGAVSGNLKNTTKIYEIQYSTTGGEASDIMNLSDGHLEFY